jgi:heme-degrading monooxygenase HmoA
MGPPLVTTIDATVPVEREEELLDAYRQLNEEARPEGLLRSELLRGQDGAWRIQTTWRDKEALLALRRSGRPHTAQVLLDRVGVAHSPRMFTVEQSVEA